MTNDLTIADVLSRNVSVDWYEAVAVVRDVGERLTASPALSGKTPELDDVRLTPSGRVEVQNGTRSDDPVRRLAQLLQALVSQSDAPVQLRLLISQATAPTPTFKSVQEFTDALAYFERPQRDVILSRLYSRAEARPSTEPVAAAPTLDVLAPLPESQTQAAPKPRKNAPRKHWKLAAAAALVLIASGAAVQFARTRGIAGETRARLAVAAGRASERIGGAVLSGASNVTELLGLGRVVPSDQPASAPPASPVPAPRHITHFAPTLHAQSVPFSAFDLEPVSAATESSANAGTTGNDSPPAADAASHLEPASLDETTYDISSEGVTPPVAIRPRLPRELPPSMDRDSLSQIDLVVDVDGTVESVKLHANDPTVLETMFLSVAKAWQFEPALRNGMPVKYRKTIWVLNP